MVHVTTGIVVRDSAGTTQVKPQRLVESWNAKTERDTVSRPCSAPENKAFLPLAGKSGNSASLVRWRPHPATNFGTIRSLN